MEARCDGGKTGQEQILDKPNVVDIEVTERIAWDAIKYTKEKLPLGSVNKKSDQDKPCFEQALFQLSKLRLSYSDLLTKFMQINIAIGGDGNQQLLLLQCVAIMCLEHQAGNCIEQSIVALDFLKNNNIDDVDWCSMDDGDHYFLIINGSIICDPWANDVYHVSEFEKKKALSQDAQYSDIVYSAIPDVKPYLFGTPQTLFSTGHLRRPAIEDGKFVRALN